MNRYDLAAGMSTPEVYPHIIAVLKLTREDKDVIQRSEVPSYTRPRVFDKYFVFQIAEGGYFPPTRLALIVLAIGNIVTNLENNAIMVSFDFLGDERGGAYFGTGGARHKFQYGERLETTGRWDHCRCIHNMSGLLS